MLERHLSRFFAQCQIERTAHVVVGVSGGVDSLALLHAASTVWSKGQITVAHLNHLLRKEAAEDAQLVEKIAQTVQLRCILEEADVTALSKQSGNSIETAARIARYTFLADVATQQNAQYIIVAHHADDQAETVLMNLLRGAGLDGLGGMRPIAPVPHAPHLTLLRPFLTLPKSDLMAYCDKHHLHPRHDASNDDTTYFRNRVRHEIRPVLAAHSPHLRERLVQLADVVAAESDYLSDQTNETLTKIVRAKENEYVEFDKVTWRALPLALQRRTLRAAVQLLSQTSQKGLGEGDNKVEISFTTLEQARQIAQSGELNAQSTLPCAITLTVEYDTIKLATRIVGDPIDAPQLIRPIKKLIIPSTTQLANGWTITAEHIPSPPLHTITTNTNRWQTWIDTDIDIDITPREQGERMKPLGMNGSTKPLKTIMIDTKIPAAHRAMWPIVRCGDEIVWVVGYARGEWGRITADSKYVLHLRCEKGSND